ncbi:MAG: hypothetical protein ACYS22_14340, partial [Planctomycetota bacterium]
MRLAFWIALWIWLGLCALRAVAVFSPIYLLPNVFYLKMGLLIYMLGWVPALMLYPGARREADTERNDALSVWAKERGYTFSPTSPVPLAAFGFFVSLAKERT